jgi:hypothetical protein
MLTRFFGKSSPVNFLILGIVLGLSYVGYQLFVLKSGFDTIAIVKLVGLPLLLVLTLLLLDFIVRKNNLTRTSTLAVFFFTCFTLMIPMAYGDPEILIANTFCLFALRRVFSFTSERNSEKKLLDASIWIFVASYFYFYSLVYFAAIYFAILRSPNTKFRYLFIPSIALLGVVSLITSVHLLVEDSFNWFDKLNFSIGLEATAYNSWNLLIPASLILTWIIWITFYRLFKVSSIMRKQRPNFVVLIVVLIISLLVALGAPEKNGSELYFVIPPLAIGIADYIENSESGIFRELILWLSILIPVGLVFL